MKIKKILFTILLLSLITLLSQYSVFGIDLNNAGSINSSSDFSNNTQTNNETDNNANLSGNNQNTVSSTNELQNSNPNNTRKQ